MEGSDNHQEPKEKKKIHFDVPSATPTQLDPRQVEMIRRRRPTPATLFRVADHPLPEEDYSANQWVVGESGILRAKRVHPNIYQPPPLRVVQEMAEAHMQRLGVYPHVEEEVEKVPQDQEEHEITTDSQEQTNISQETDKHQTDTRAEEEEGNQDEEEDEEEETDDANSNNVELQMNELKN